MLQQIFKSDNKRFSIFRNSLFDKGQSQEKAQCCAMNCPRNNTDREKAEIHPFFEHSGGESNSKSFNRRSEPRKKIFSLRKIDGHISGSRSQACRFSRTNSICSLSQERRHTIFGKYELHRHKNPENEERAIEKLIHLVNQFQKSQIQIIEERSEQLKQSTLIAIASTDKNKLNQSKQSTEHYKTPSVSCRQIMSPQELAQLVIKIKIDAYNSKKQIIRNSHNKKVGLKLNGALNNLKGEGKDERQRVSDKIS